MAKRGTVRDVMTRKPVTCASTATVFDAAKKMSEEDIGDVIVLDGKDVCGIVTDRDVVVRVIAAGKDPKKTKLGSICSKELTAVRLRSPTHARFIDGSNRPCVSVSRGMVCSTCATSPQVSI